MGFIMPPCMDGCRRSPRPKSKAVQFAIPTAQYFPRHLEPGTSSNLLALAPAPALANLAKMAPFAVGDKILDDVFELLGRQPW